MDTDPADDYYTLLGIDPSADEAELRRAWKRLALRWHPDRAGVRSTAVFQMLSAAYNVLSDPIARAAYDRRRGATVRRPATRAPPARAAPPVEPRKRAPGVMLRRLTGPLDALMACGVARRQDDGTVELFVNAQEAEQGGMVTISMRVPVRCAACEGIPSASCVRCEARGSTDELFSAWLAIPPGVADGTVLSPSAQLPRMVRPASFRVRLRSAA